MFVKFGETYVNLINTNCIRKSKNFVGEDVGIQFFFADGSQNEILFKTTQARDEEFDAFEMFLNRKNT